MLLSQINQESWYVRELVRKKPAGGLASLFIILPSILDHWLNSWKGSKPLLDIGCGHGVNTHAALIHGANVVATDMDKPDLSEWQNDLPATHQAAITCRATKLPEKIPFERQCLLRNSLC